MNSGVVMLEPDPRHDQSQLVRGGTGKDSSAVLGMALFVLIEATVVLSLVTSYFYFRVMSRSGWPPPGFALPELPRSAAATLLLVIGVAALAGGHRAAAQGHLGYFRVALSVAMALAAGYVVLSSLDLGSLDFDWTRHVYASLVWTLSGYQYFHALTLVSLSAGTLILGWKGRFMGARRAPLQAMLIYWAFVAVSSVLTYVVVYLSPHLV